jgi:hypothetical protein
MFLLPLYAKVEAEVMVCMLSPPSIRNHVKYDLLKLYLMMRLWSEVDHVCRT